MKTPLSLEPVIDAVYKVVPNIHIGRIPEKADENVLRELLTVNAAHFNARELLVDILIASGDVGAACQLRMDGALLLSELIDESDIPNEEIVLDWDDSFTAKALTMVFDSATDHFIIGDFEISAAMLELLVDHDQEDHLNAAPLLAFCYVALEEWELFEETLLLMPADDLTSKLATYWADFRNPGQLEVAKIREAMKRENSALYEVLISDSHDASTEYLTDIDSRRPTEASLALQIWLQTEPLWRAHPEFIEFLKGSK